MKYDTFADSHAVGLVADQRERGTSEVLWECHVWPEFCGEVTNTAGPMLEQCAKHRFRPRRISGASIIIRSPE
jgi:hypothetical protein